MWWIKPIGTWPSCISRYGSQGGRGRRLPKLALARFRYVDRQTVGLLPALGKLVVWFTGYRYTSLADWLINQHYLPVVNITV